MTALVPGRGVLGCEYAGDLANTIERTNCLKGCIHATPEGQGDDAWINCDLGLLTRLFFDAEPIPEFELHGNRYVVCLKRQPPEPEPPVDLGPDLFEVTE